MTDIRLLCQSSILQHTDISFDFDVSTITEKEILDNCVKSISAKVFNSRPATGPYVDALLLFASYLHKHLQHKVWYNSEMLIDVMSCSLEEINFKPQLSLFNQFKRFVIKILEYVYLY